MTVVVYPGDGRKAREEAKQNCCRWDPAAREWFVTVTSESSLRPWHRARMVAPPEYVIRVEYAERDAAKGAGCRWRPEIKQWVFACHGPPPGFRAEARDCGVKGPLEHHSQALARAGVRRVAHGAAQGALEAPRTANTHMIDFRTIYSSRKCRGPGKRHCAVSPYALSACVEQPVSRGAGSRARSSRGGASDILGTQC